jgi:hypothetical protein
MVIEPSGSSLRSLFFVPTEKRLISLGAKKWCAACSVSDQKPLTGACRTPKRCQSLMRLGRRYSLLLHPDSVVALARENKSER